ncbi:PPK2 family polyphosphate kinase [Nocardioides sp. W7]|uniref:PPK2 family polyphosphate kinase n=1 Tax=Nocardioides sp. W7 TaxID=2931390 RepID=UPI001FD2354D|nr:PPK2 family polyphosphate kinase [Nocardioides sp. W7]
MVADLLRVPAGPVDLRAIATDATPGFDGDKKAGRLALADLGEELAGLQERLWAEGQAGASRRLLLVLQGMDTSGKGGTLKHTVGLVDPQGVRITSFKAPTEEERAHDFLWRIERALPGPGYLGVFDRSHYEDVLIARVRGLASVAEIERRYDAIVDFEHRLVESGTTVVKVMLHISSAEQKERLLARLDDPAKHWKFNSGDIDERAHWSAYREAYEIALERTGTEAAPWHVVPADRKWYRDLAIAQLLLEALRGLDPQWPVADFDVTHERARLTGEEPIA